MTRIVVVLTGVVFFATAGVCQQILPYHYFAKPIVVDIQQEWTDTGIDVAANDTIEILVKGIASTQGNVDRGEVAWLGPDGSGNGLAASNFAVPNVPAQSVIGKIGQSGPGFYVGSVVVLRATEAGRLYLGYNDNPATLPWSGNFGYYVAFVVTRPTFGHTSIPDGEEEPQSIEISQNYPNPFNPSTRINFRLSTRDNVTVGLYNSEGRLVRTLIDEQRDAGEYSVTWDGKNDNMIPVSTGAYFYQVRVGSLVQTKKMLLIK